MRTVHPTPTGMAYDVRWYNWLAAGVLLAILLSFVSAFPLAGQPPGAESFGGRRRVPSIMGQSAMEANATLRQSGLGGRDSGREQSAEYRSGTVARQEPRAGDLIPQNRVVAYWLAEQGPTPTSQVPSIMGQSAEGANATLRQSGLRGRDSGREQSAKYRPGTVARQDPRPGDPIPQNRVIAYWLAPVSTGLVDQLKRWLHVVTVADVVKILGALAAIFLVAFILTKLIPHHKIKVVPLKDYGEQHVTSPPGPLVFAVELCPVLDPGNQELDKVGPLVEQGGSQWISNV